MDFILRNPQEQGNDQEVNLLKFVHDSRHVSAEVAVNHRAGAILAP